MTEDVGDAAVATGSRRFVPTAITAVLVIFAALPVSSGSAGDREDPVRLTPELLGRIVGFTEPWAYHPGDDPAWADPNLDDSAWPLVDTRLRDVDEVPGGWPGVGWFRRRVVLDPSIQRVTVGVFPFQAGAMELYVDGGLAARFGTVSPNAELERGVAPQSLDAIVLDPGKVQVLAVRYSNSRDNVLPEGLRGFLLWMGEVQPMIYLGVDYTRKYWGVMAAACGVFAVFGLLHLLLFLSRTELRENLLFALFNFAVVAALGTELWMNSLSDLIGILLAFKFQMTFFLAMILAALLLERRIFGRRVDWVFWVVAAYGIAVLGWIWTRPALADVHIIGVLAALGYLDMLRLAAGALLRRVPDAWVVALGFLALTLSLILAVLRNLGLIGVSPWLLLGFGMGTLVLCLSLYLTRRIVRIDRNLAARALEVRELTQRTLEQERAAREQEIERRVLEADNRRKTEELEEARRLQLAMLPAELPHLRGFELAVHMATASEVGGDYYDFLTADDGQWTLALGDATGHGMHAGMVVGVAKSLLQSANGLRDLPRILDKIHSGLISLHERRAGMSLLLVQVNGHELVVASAGMPPLLVRRQATGDVEEILLPGVPLGTLGRASWLERRVEVSDGDAVLLMSDGLAEVLGPDDEPFGYGRVRREFSTCGGGDPETVVAHLVAAAERYRAGRPINDDLTLLLLKARRAES